MRRVIVAGAVLLLTVGVARAETVIETFSFPSSPLGNLGEGDVATMGQTFVAPPIDTFLDTFQFDLDDLPGQAVTFAAYVMAWDDTRPGATGAVLWQSGPLTTTNNGGAGGYERFVVTAAPRVALTAGQKYVIFLSASEYLDGTSDQGTSSAVAGTAYPDGELAVLNNGADTGAWSAGTWLAFPFDLSFSLTFQSTVPVELQHLTVE